MAIRNNVLGGVDWAPGELAKSVDLNDTFDATITRANTYAGFEKYTLVQTLTPSDSTQDVTLDSGKKYKIIMSGTLADTFTVNGASSGNYAWTRIWVHGHTASEDSANSSKDYVTIKANARVGITKIDFYCTEVSTGSYKVSGKLETIGGNTEGDATYVIFSSDVEISSNTFTINFSSSTSTIKIYEVTLL